MTSIQCAFSHQKIHHIYIYKHTCLRQNMQKMGTLINHINKAIIIHNLVYRIEQNIHECVFIVPSSDTFSNPFFFSQQCTAPCNYSTLQAHQPENAILNVMYNKTKK